LEGVIQLSFDSRKVIAYWRDEAEEDLKVAGHLLEKGDYSYSLFFGHLATEKILKAIYVLKKGEHAPFVHNLVRLATEAGIELSEENKKDLIRITAFHLEARYPDENRSFREKCSKDFSEHELAQIKVIYRWLKSMIP